MAIKYMQAILHSDIRDMFAEFAAKHRRRNVDQDVHASNYSIAVTPPIPNPLP